MTNGQPSRERKKEKRSDKITSLESPKANERMHPGGAKYLTCKVIFTI